ncbi:MAG: hypothetical protein K2P88_07660 [Chitinophagaceae bacterium]|nr:hypothetical protein [Chitinophagaceae bacterium]
MHRLALATCLLLFSCNGTTTNKEVSATAPTEPANVESKEPAKSDASTATETTAPASNNNMEQPSQTSNLDNRIFGTWKNTEVITSGSGDNFGSFSSETFIEFTADGVFATWAGQSAGSGGGQSFESNGSSQKQSLKYRTEDRMIVFVDPSSGQEAKTKYAVDGSRLMLSDGAGHNKIYIKE